METESGLVCAYLFDGKGNARQIEMSEAEIPVDAGFVWLHWQLDDHEARRWLTRRSGIDPIAVDAILAPETRPRCTFHDDGIILILRGINLEPNADPEDMVSIRLWIEANRIVSTRVRRLAALEELQQSITTGKAPSAPIGFVTALSARLANHMAPVLIETDDSVDDLAEVLIDGDEDTVAEKLGDIRRQIVSLRRHVAPLGEALLALGTADSPWISKRDRRYLREVGDQVKRFLETLDNARERAGLLNDELTLRLTERTGRTTLFLTVIAAIFLPLSFVTGLLGINVGGIPGAAAPWAFTIVAVGLALLGAVAFWVFRRLKWI